MMPIGMSMPQPSATSKPCHLDLSNDDPPLALEAVPINVVKNKMVNEHPFF